MFYDYTIIFRNLPPPTFSTGILIFMIKMFEKHTNIKVINEEGDNSIDQENKKRICIIGGGVRGICALKHFSKSSNCHVDLYETEKRLFNSRRLDGEKSNVFNGEVASMPTIVVQFATFPFTKVKNCFPTQQQILEYLEDYSNDIQSFIKFNHRVVKTEYVKEDTNWIVTIKRENDNEIITLRYDIILVCSGRKDIPFIPTVLNSYRGNLLHSKDFKNPENYKNQNIGIIGIAKKIYFFDVTYLHRNFKKNTFPDDFINVQATEYKIYFEGNKLFRKNEECDGIQLDTLISATGYQLNYPFLEKEEYFNYTSKKRDIQDLILNFLHYKYANSLFFIGLEDQDETFKYIDIQVRTIYNIIFNKHNSRKLGILWNEMEALQRELISFQENEDIKDNNNDDENEIHPKLLHYNLRVNSPTIYKDLKELGQSILFPLDYKNQAFCYSTNPPFFTINYDNCNV
ncbi:Flavin monooxygenase FMO family and Flavin monooxygenase-like family-containing protein [Strongyloides ratti]|uniref:Flavin-containing monooxygenase n=1 Tax=Strongyloides ratti TaxID=34506 RepID=A0A090MY57_STRRB|nr:Flavin monooxygenase FMO family and Flavin monooxygenase-like family-containing protein [Strongyloides ratti]CEF66604.1 Flavin monooxygenase FMO family and Flavin monooxygenase-like family-containing protein [Strongyloides ratti]